MNKADLAVQTRTLIDVKHLLVQEIDGVRKVNSMYDFLQQCHSDIIRLNLMEAHLLPGRYLFQWNERRSSIEVLFDTGVFAMRYFQVVAQVAPAIPLEVEYFYAAEGGECIVFIKPFPSEF